MEIKQVTLKEEEKVQFLLEESAHWLKSIGSRQWNEILQGKDKHEIKSAVQRGEVYFLYDKEDTIVGMFTAWRTASSWDKQLWGKIGLADNCYYVHRIIIRPKFRRKKYGNQLLTELKKNFEADASELRLDCLANNRKLVNFYFINGFQTIGRGKSVDGETFELFSYFF